MKPLCRKAAFEREIQIWEFGSYANFIIQKLVQLPAMNDNCMEDVPIVIVFDVNWGSEFHEGPHCSPSISKCCQVQRRSAFFVQSIHRSSLQMRIRILKFHKMAPPPEPTCEMRYSTNSQWSNMAAQWSGVMRCKSQDRKQISFSSGWSCRQTETRT